MTPEALLAAHGEELGRIAFVVLQDQGEAEQIVARTLAAACRAGSLPRDTRQRRLWLLRAALREARRRSARPTHVDPVLPVQEAGVGGQAVDVRSLHWAFAELPIRARALLALRELADLDGEELVDVVGGRPADLDRELAEIAVRLRRALESPPADWVVMETIDGP